MKLSSYCSAIFFLVVVGFLDVFINVLESKLIKRLTNLIRMNMVLAFQIIRSRINCAVHRVSNVYIENNQYIYFRRCALVHIIWSEHVMRYLIFKCVRLHLKIGMKINHKLTNVFTCRGIAAFLTFYLLHLNNENCFTLNNKQPQIPLH